MNFELISLLDTTYGTLEKVFVILKILYYYKCFVFKSNLNLDTVYLVENIIHMYVLIAGIWMLRMSWKESLVPECWGKKERKCRKINITTIPNALLIIYWCTEINMMLKKRQFIWQYSLK